MTKLLIGLALLAASAVQATPPPEVAAATIALTKRMDDGPYGTSAYSFRYGTQDVAIHKNSVDLVWNGCGNLHVRPEAGLKSRITKTMVTSLANVRDFPSGGWKSDCIPAEAGAVYVLEIDDGTTKMRLKLRIAELTGSAMKLEWAPFRDMNIGLGGTMGKCSGKHGCS